MGQQGLPGTVGLQHRALPLPLQVMVTTGGTSLKDDIMRLYQTIHIVVATPVSKSGVIWGQGLASPALTSLR